MFEHKKLLMLLLRSLAVILAVTLIALAMIALMRTQIRTIARETHEREKLNATLASRNELVAGLSADFARMRDARPMIEAALPPSSNILAFVGALESLAAKDSMQQTVHFENPTPANLSFGTPPVAIDTVGFSMALSGNVFTFLQYLRDFEKLPYAVKIDGITITAGADGWSNTSNISMHGTLYTKDDQ